MRLTVHEDGNVQIDLEQIQMSLRHEKIDTTIKYINPDQDFADPPGERLGLVIRRRQDG